MVEMLGAPGAGKTTMLEAIEAAARERGIDLVTPHRDARRFARRTRLGRVVAALAPRRQTSRALWGVYRVVGAWHTLRFASEHPGLTRYVLRSQRSRPPDADSARRRVLYWYLRTMGTQRFLLRHSRPDEILLLDEGFVHRAVQLHASSVEVPDRLQISEYVSRLPRPDLVVNVVASVPVCRNRVESRGVWERLSHRGHDEIDRFVANAHTAAVLAREEIGSRGWSVIDVDNDTDDPAAAGAALAERLDATLFTPRRTVGVES